MVKRAPFSSWAGEVQPGDGKTFCYLCMYIQYNAMKTLISSGKRAPFSSWAGKRKRAPFSSWAGKRAPFSSWAGKRSGDHDFDDDHDDWMQEESQGRRIKRSSDEDEEEMMEVLVLCMVLTLPTVLMYVVARY